MQKAIVSHGGNRFSKRLGREESTCLRRSLVHKNSSRIWCNTNEKGKRKKKVITKERRSEQKVWGWEENLYLCPGVGVRNANLQRRAPSPSLLASSQRRGLSPSFLSL